MFAMKQSSQKDWPRKELKFPHQTHSLGHMIILEKQFVQQVQERLLELPLRVEGDEEEH